MSNTVVSESLVRNAVIGQLTSRDPDRGSEITYVKLSEVSGHHFVHFTFFSKYHYCGYFLYGRLMVNI